MKPLRALSLTIATFSVTVCIARSDASAPPRRDGSASTAGAPFALSFRGGALNGSQFDWSRSPTNDHASPVLPTVGVAFEAHRISRFVLGGGFDVTWQIRQRSSIYNGRNRRTLLASFVYGSVGTYVWTGIGDGARAWIAFDVGRIWAKESGTSSSVATTLPDSFAGTLFRFRASGTRSVGKWLAFGADAGWQWAAPSISDDDYHSPGETRRLDLSGPFLTARLSLISPLGK